MPLADDLQERERQAGNAETDNLGQKAYDEQFNGIAKADEDKDFDQIIADNYGDSASSEKTDAHGDTVKRNWNADDATPDVKDQEENPDSLYKQSDDKNIPRGFMGRLGPKAKKFGPAGGIIGLMLFALVGVGGVSGTLAGSLLINVKEIFHNDRADATRTNRIFGRATTANMVNNKNNCKKKTPICTKMSTSSVKQVEDYVKKGGFKVKGVVIDADGNPTGERVGDTDSDLDSLDSTKRVQIEQMEYPDGTVVKNGKELYAHADNRPSSLRSLERAFPSRASYYTNKFFNNMLNTKFKITKVQAKYPEGDDEESRKKQNQQFDNEGQFKTDEASKQSEATRITNSAADTATKGKEEGNTRGKGGAVGTVFRGICTSYDLAKIAETGIKVYHAAELARFALLFFRAADQIKDQKGDAPLVWRLSDRLTYADRNEIMTTDTDYAKKGGKNPRYNLAATDSEGYQIAAHGSTGGLKSFSQQYILGGGIGKKIDGFTSAFENTASKVPGVNGSNGRQNMKSMCRLINGNIPSLVAACAGLPIAAQGIGSTVPGLGNLAALVAGGVGCVCTAGSVAEDEVRENENIIGDILGRTINIATNAVSLGLCQTLENNAKQITDYALDTIKSEKVQGWVSDILTSLNISSETRGVDAGNAIAAGAGLMLSTTATGYGLAPASSANKNQEISNYIAYTQPLEEKYIALEKQDASQQPFNPDNKYSLVGSIVRSLKPKEIPTGTVYGMFSTLSNLYENSFKIATAQQSVNALYSQPSQAANGASGRFDHCEDEDLASIGAAADPTCSIIGVSDRSQLDSATKQAYTPGDQTISNLIDWMQSEHPEDEASGGTKCEKNDIIDVGGSCADSQKASIDDNGKPIEGSQYSMWIKYCSDQRSASWGGQYEMSYYGSQRDQDWYTGLECMDRFGEGADKKPSDMIRNFRDWTNYCLQRSTMDGASNCWDTTAAVTQSGDACSLLNNPNVVLVQQGTKDGLKKICETGHATNSCGQDFTINPLLINTITTLSSKYKVWLNNFGFKEDRYSCDSGQHPKGNAIDLNGIEILNGGGRAGGDSWGGLNYSASQVPVIQAYASDWLAALPPDRGGVGQKGCGGGRDSNPAFNPTFPAGSVNVNGAAFFDDSCDHLHIDIRNRGNLNAV